MGSGEVAYKDSVEREENRSSPTLPGCALEAEALAKVTEKGPG